MNKPEGYDGAQGKQFGIFFLPDAGAYVLGIIKAEITTSRSGNEMIVLSLDIAEGPFKGHFRQFSDDVQKDRLLKYYRLTSGEQLPYFKGDMETVEKCNPGYKFNFDEATLRGKFVGGMLVKEEYRKQGGSVGTVLKISYLCALKKARSGELTPPPAKKLNDGEPPVVAENNSFDDDDLPF